MGPFIVPKEFVSNPQALGIKVILNGKIFQEGTSADMIHNIYEQVQYASNIMSLRPGDVVATGTREFSEMIKRDTARWVEVVKVANIKIE